MSEQDCSDGRCQGPNVNLTKKGIDSNTYKYLQSFIEANYYGQFDIPMMIRGVVEANKLASTLVQ